MNAGWVESPLELEVDLDHGGRWTSLRTGTREWLWTNPDAATAARRLGVQPGAAFVDAGGVEECFPTVRGVPDHGDVWSRPWNGSLAESAVSAPGVAYLRRAISLVGGSIVVAYEVDGRPETLFVHAVHALLDVSPAAELVLPAATTMTVLDVDDPLRAWPSGLDQLGPDDGTATCALVPHCDEALVVDGEHALRLTWRSSTQPDLGSLLLWRNLCGWPDGNPYRSIGIEPMIGGTADVADPDGSTARIGSSGRHRWSLTVSAFQRTSSERLPSAGGAGQARQ